MAKYVVATNTGVGFITHQDRNDFQIQGYPADVWILSGELDEEGNPVVEDTYDEDGNVTGTDVPVIGNAQDGWNTRISGTLQADKAAAQAVVDAAGPYEDEEGNPITVTLP